MSRKVPVIVIDSPRTSNCAEDVNRTNKLQDAIPEEESEDEEGTLPVPENPDSDRKSSLRRTSVSLPNLSDLQLQYLQKLHEQALEASENGTRSDIYNSENDFTDDEDLVVAPKETPFFREQIRVPLRNARRKSITISPRMLKPPHDDEDGTNSITSINSLASLLREKMQMLPTTIKKKKPRDYKIRAFVAFLFLTIIFLVSFAYVLYHQKVLQKVYFDRIKFNKAKRSIRIFHTDGSVILKARLGTTLNYGRVNPCLAADLWKDGSICFEWMQRARLYLNYYDMNSDVRCYNFHWVSLAEEIDPTDCLDMSGGNWYGGGQTAESAWPLEKGEHDFAPFITGRVAKQQWGNVLKRYFIGSKGAAVVVDNDSPLHVAIKGDKELCLKAKYDDFAYVNRLTPFPHLNYSICTTSNITRLHSAMSEKFLWDGLKKEDSDAINFLLTEPLWQITSLTREDLTEATVSNYTGNLVDLGYFKQGHVLINEFWQKDVGDFTVDTDRFPSLEEAIIIMHRRGFRIVFSIQPFISTESTNFAEAVQKRLLISERFSDRRIPALTRYKSLQSAGVLDVTNTQTIPWLLEKLNAVKSKYNLDAFYLDMGVAYNLPRYYQCEKTLRNPDQYKTPLIASLQSNLALLGVNSAVERPRAPTFVSLPLFESSWDGLRRVIPTILTYGILGYPLLIPGAVGGDYEINALNNKTIHETSILLPDKELYVRWLQLATFLPVIRFTHLPSTYGDQRVLEMAKLLTVLRQVTVSPLLVKYTRDALEWGIPLIRPLWMLEPNDPACYIVKDEFAVGEELIVAPVLYSGAREREVYLPTGVWKDGNDGSYRKGNRWIHDYKVQENQIAYFQRMPDDTRF